LLEQGVEFDRATRLFLAEKYGCSESAILADIERCQFLARAKTQIASHGWPAAL
jgi:hypothetical protein